MVRKSKYEKEVARYFFALMVAVLMLGFSGLHSARAEYGDIIINQQAEKEGMPPVVFPHWFHRIRFRCKVCHADLGFHFKAGGTGINMLKIIDGEYCGACHNGKIAWSVENCNMCHSGKAGEKTHVDGSTRQQLLVPTASKPSKRKGK